MRCDLMHGLCVRRDSRIRFEIPPLLFALCTLYLVILVRCRNFSDEDIQLRRQRLNLSRSLEERLWYTGSPFHFGLGLKIRVVIRRTSLDPMTYSAISGMLMGSLEVAYLSGGTDNRYSPAEVHDQARSGFCP